MTTIASDLATAVKAGAFTPTDADDLLKDAARLKGRVVVVTGAASGFGEQYARLAAQYGAKVVLGDLNTDKVAAVAESIRTSGGEATHYAPCNVAIWEDQLKLFKHGADTFGYISVAVANARIGGDSLFAEDVMEDSPDGPQLKRPNLAVMDVNVNGVIFTAKLGLHYMRKNPEKIGKSIVIVGSFASFYGSAITVAYTASKHAVLGFTRAFSYAAAVDDVKVQMIAPTFAETGIVASLRQVWGEKKYAAVPMVSVEDVVCTMIAASTDDRPTATIYAIAPGHLLVSQNAMTPFALPRM
jgi:NAD(P)-dependent dehydrogenase (short-subunit alcohol dehydrogenase family)